MDTDKVDAKPKRLVTWERLPNGDADQPVQNIDWAARSGSGRKFLRGLERFVLAVESLANKLIGDLQLNPFYHTDTIAFFLLIVAGVTGAYLVVFFQFGYQASYESVAKMNRFPISHIVRGVHRYASAALMIFTLLHALRVFFQDRFRGARRPAWVWGVVMTVALWIAGVSGYLLLWDMRAQLIMQSIVELLQPFPALVEGFYAVFLSPEGAEQSWLYMVLFLGLHVGASALGGLFFWYHIQRLKRPKLFPARHWMIGIGLILAVLALVVPAGLLPMADFAQHPGATPLDWVYLFYVPLALRGSWLGLLLSLAIIAALLAAVPWIIRRQEPPRIVVTPDLCIGCKLCVEDCPYGALTMQPRADASRHKEIAFVDQTRCVACGICIGSCNTLALNLGERPASLLWQDISTRLNLARVAEKPSRVIFACERHMAHGARPFLRRSPDEPAPVVGDVAVEVVPVTCAAAVNPGLLVRTLEAGAAEAQVVGCPPDDCANREGNLWLEARLARERAPKLRSKFADAPILTAWLPPDKFEQALAAHTEERLKADEKRAEDEESLTWAWFLSPPNWRSLVIGLAWTTVFLVLAVVLANLPYTP